MRLPISAQILPPLLLQSTGFSSGFPRRSYILMNDNTIWQLTGPVPTWNQLIAPSGETPIFVYAGNDPQTQNDTIFSCNNDGSIYVTQFTVGADFTALTWSRVTSTP